MEKPASVQYRSGSPRAKELSGLRVAYIAFEGIPNHKGSGTRIGAMTAALCDAGAETTLLALSGRAGSTPPAHFVPIRLLEDNYLSRVLAFRDAVLRALFALRPDVVHFRGPFEGQAALSYAASQGAKTVFEVNGLPSIELRYHYPSAARSPFEEKLKKLEHDVLTQCDRVITQSLATRRFLEFRAKTPLPIFVVPNGADPARYQPQARTDVPQVLYLGSLAPWQGVGDLLLAAAQTQKRIPFFLRVIGPSRKRWKQSLSRRVQKLKLSQSVSIEEPLDRAALTDRVAASDICVAPLPRDLRNRIQGCSPIKIFEYMAAGRAVLATDLPCTREIVEPGVTGVLTRPSHPKRFRDALSALLCEEDQRNRLGQRAKRYIQDHATWKHQTQKLLTVYRDLVSR